MWVLSIILTIHFGGLIWCLIADPCNLAGDRS